MNAKRNAGAWCEHPWWQPVAMLAALAVYSAVMIPVHQLRRGLAAVRRRVHHG